MILASLLLVAPVDMTYKWDGMYVDGSIRAVLMADRSQRQHRTLVSLHDLTINWEELRELNESFEPNFGKSVNDKNKSLRCISNGALIDLAYYCEDILFNLSRDCQILSDLSDIPTSHTMGIPNGDDSVSSISSVRTVSPVIPLHLQQLLPTFILDLIRIHDQIEYHGNVGTNDDCDLHCVVASQFVLNMLETAIRKFVLPNCIAGKAPLLKDMIEMIPFVASDANDDMDIISSSDVDIFVAIIRSLLLPIGVNLRNLLWHGFLTKLPRRWFALCIVILHNFCSVSPNNNLCSIASKKITKPFMFLRDVTTTKSFVDHGIYLYENKSDIYKNGSFFPISHQPLVNIAFQLYGNSPACFAAILSPVIEHSLRLIWCECNNRQYDSIAHQHEYYVTLDGHGQRDKHEMVLKPYYSKNCEENEKNMLIEDTCLGGTAIALLTDLFASSGSGPNIRATIAHGVWDDYILYELSCCNIDTESNVDRRLESPLQDILYILLALLHLLQSRLSSSCIYAFPSGIETMYRPTFSYYATLNRHLDKILTDLRKLCDRLVEVGNSKIKSEDDLIFMTMIVPPDIIKSLKEYLLGDLFTSFVSWTSDDVRTEYIYNVKLSLCGVSRVLLVDVLEAISEVVSFYDSFEQKLYNNRASRKGIERYSRISSLLYVVVGVYSFATFIALLHIKEKIGELPEEMGRKKLLPDVSLADTRTVERARMCVSTFSTYLFKNTDRALKAAENFAASKGCKDVVQQMNEE